MATTCYDTGLLNYSGTSQLQRALQALLAGYAKVDERTTAQLILFTKKYAAYLNYFDDNNQVADDWQAFMSHDVSVTIAAIADWNAKAFTPFIAHANDEVRDAASDEEAKKHFKTLFDFVFTLAFLLEASLKRLPDDVSYKTFLSVAYESSLKLPLSSLYYYYNQFKNASLPLIDETSTYIDPYLPVSPVILSQSFSFDIGSFTAPAISLGGVSAKDDISHILTHNLFTGPLQLFKNGVINIVSKTPAYLEATLNNYPAHEPHYALYLAFLRLFRFAQEHINNFTQNHLDYYYKDVLQLTNRNAEPGFVHLLFELQKSAQQHLIAKNTPFKAGKDASGKEIFYAVTNDVVLQKATVQSLQSLYLDKNVAGTLYASPVANSDDGKGAKLTSADKSWFAFGNPDKIATAEIGFAIASNVLFLNEGTRVVTLTFNSATKTNISASRLLKMFTIRLTGKKDWHTVLSYEVTTLLASSFSLKFTLNGDVPPIIPYSEKIHKAKFDTSLPVVQAILNNYDDYQAMKDLDITTIDISVSATVKNLSLHSKDGKIDPAKPFKPFGDYPDEKASFIIGSEEIFQKKLTALSVKIDWQPADTALASAVVNKQKSFSDRVAGFDTELSKEIAFSESKAKTERKRKANNAFGRSITVEEAKAEKSGNAKATTSESKSNPSARSVKDVSFAANSMAITEMNAEINAKLDAPVQLLALSAGKWLDAPLASSTDITSNGSISAETSKLISVPVTESAFDGNDDYVVDSISGFVKLSLTTANYSLATYLSNLQSSMEASSVTVTYDGDKVKSYNMPAPKLALPAPQLMANAVSVDYTATATIDCTTDTETAFESSNSYFYHTEPFGLRKMHPFITDDAITFLPVFNLDNGQPKQTGGELWIGLKDAFPAATLTILLQVSDGSSNPLKNITSTEWFYLTANNWLPFDSAAVSDETNNLSRSGIVTITLPDLPLTGNTRADATLTWIKLVVGHDTDAVCKLIAVTANAAKAVFVQDLSKGIEYNNTLAAGIISKPATPIAEIKKTEQLYASFGGRLHESNDRFYIRVSERLRHKHRAVTQWDYERLVLDYYPQIHKTKCINHTGFIENKNTGTFKYSELLPGHVMVVTIPDLKNNSFANLLRPYTSVGLLEEIRQYLSKLISPFVKLHVTNPQFEEVQFDFGVTFLPGYDISFYTNLLNNEIEQFLTPWAYESGRDIEFGGKIEKSVVLNFVEERPYVDFLTCFQMNHFIRNESGAIITSFYNIEEAVASTARSILVSYAEDNDSGTPVKHIINSPANCNC